MYCQYNENADNSCVCTARCCQLYNFALAFLAVIILFAAGIIIGANFASTFTEIIPILITAAIILFILFLVTLITRGCCENRDRGV